MTNTLSSAEDTRLSDTTTTDSKLPHHDKHTYDHEQKVLESCSNDSFKSPTDMLKQDLLAKAAEADAASATQQPLTRSRRRRRRRRQQQQQLRRHTSFEMRQKKSLLKRQMNMSEFLNDIKTSNSTFHESIMDFVSSDEEVDGTTSDTTNGDGDDVVAIALQTAMMTSSKLNDSCPILSYFDSDGEDSIDLARVRHPEEESNTAASAAAMSVDDADQQQTNEGEEEDLPSIPVPPMTNYILALPEVVSESAKREARGRTKRRRSYTRRRRERVRATGGLMQFGNNATKSAGTKGDSMKMSAYHASLANWNHCFSDPDESSSILPSRWDGEDDDAAARKPGAHPEHNDLGASLAAFLEEYHANRKDYDSDGGGGGKAQK